MAVDLEGIRADYFPLNMQGYTHGNLAFANPGRTDDDYNLGLHGREN
jgi:hypothetical protein